MSLILLLFRVTLFASAALLFLLEPMFAKMVLPFLGGSPAVWNTCVVFFQAAMLFGYAYAHAISARLSLRRQVALHLALVVAAAVLLPIAVPAGWTPPADRNPVPALLFLLAITVGAPFFVVSATAPLVQWWFSRTRHPRAADPYFLYASSNAGSVLALAAYPLIVEPTWALVQQGRLWAVGYALFALGIAGCGAAAVFFGAPATGAAASDVSPARPAGWALRVRWLLLSLVPSSLMLGVTTYVSTDIAAVPLLWAVPLALYLVSFVITFSPRPLIPPRVATNTFLVTMLPLALSLIAGVTTPAWLLMPLHIVAFFAAAVMLHGELARQRPSAGDLTGFYLWISVGGVLGGVLNTFVAPTIFNGVAEYPLALVAACALRPRATDTNRRWTAADAVLPLVAAGIMAGILLGVRSGALGPATTSALIGGLAVAYVASTAGRALRLAGALALMFLAGAAWGPSSGVNLYTERTFFGVLRVQADPERTFHRLFHGNTLHGEQAVQGPSAPEPRTYYHRAGPAGQIVDVVTRHQPGGHVGVVGLGAGSLAAYAQPGQQWTFYEIDPVVERIAADPAFFRYLADCRASCTVVLGDARLSLARGRRQSFQLLMLDAFSSDAIPVHLMTREALAVYLSMLAPDGVLAFHISNRHLDLQPVLGRLAAELDLTALVREDRAVAPEVGHRASDWLVMARSPEALRSLAQDERWRSPAIGEAVWTDDYSNVVRTLKWR